MFSIQSIRAILFDLDGTLRHNLPSGGEFFADQAIRLGLSASEEDRLRAIRWENYYWANSPDLKEDQRLYQQEDSYFWHNYAIRQLVALGATNRQAAELAPKINRYMEETYRPESIVPPDALRLLNTLHADHYQLAVVSNRTKPYQEELEALGLAPFFTFSLAGGEIDAWKPDPGIFLHACQRLEVEPAEAIYVGDNYFADIVGARNAGLQPVLYDPRGVFPEAGCLTIKSFDELTRVLKRP